MYPIAQTQRYIALHVAIVKWHKTEAPRLKDRPLLVVAHPGHELRLFGWLAEVRPDVVVLTDGSGYGGISRIEASRRLVVASGAHVGPLFGDYTDQQIYGAMLRKNAGIFVEMVSRLTEIICVGGYRTVVADPYEGYNPTHDLCRLIVNAAALSVRQRFGHAVRNYEYQLTQLSKFLSGPSLSISRLSVDVQLRKRLAAAAYVELTHEVRTAVQHQGESAFAEEVMREVLCDSLYDIPQIPAPFYEQYGERQRAAGRYNDVIRYADHFLPIVHAVAGMTVDATSQPKHALGFSRSLS